MIYRFVQGLVFGCGYRRSEDEAVSAATIRGLRDEWIELGMFEHLKMIVLEPDDLIVGLRLCSLNVSGGRRFPRSAWRWARES